MSYALNAKQGNRDDGESETFVVAGPLDTKHTPRGHGMAGVNDEAVAKNHVVAAPLTKGSATGDGVNAPGRRQEDDVNIVAYPISGDALREGTAKTPSADAEGKVRLRDPGLGIGGEDDPAFTPTKTHPGAIAFHATQDPVHHHHHTPALSADSSGNLAVGVRRLTPTECERLQGFPDGWTQLGDTADSKRYSALGDAVTVNVAEWIGGRLAA